MTQKPLDKRKSHKIRGIRIDDENWEWLNSIKRGTWNHTVRKLKDNFKNQKL